MKEAPIIMSDNHPKLILDGTETQTRRVIKPQPTEAGLQFATACGGEFYAWQDDGLNLDEYTEDGGGCHRLCPYGHVGDRLWVRETWASNPETGYVFFKADVPFPDIHKWKPSIHMPRWASRITLEITEVRVERLNQMDEADAIKEGIKVLLNRDTYLSEFQKLWDSLNAKRGYGWEVNPWVWCISFKLQEVMK